MWRIAIVAVALACAACELEPVPITITSPPVVAGPAPVEPPQEPPAQPDCRPFSTPVMVGGVLQQTNGQVCHEPDGSWRVVQQTPGLPIQEYHLPPEGQQPPGAVATPAASQTGCQDHTIPLTVGGRAEQATLEACPQSDGSLQVTQYTPGLPPQTYMMPPPPPPGDEVYGSGYPDYDESFDFDPYWADAPWFFGLGPTLVVVYGFNHFHHGYAYAGGARGRGSSTYPVTGTSDESGSGFQRSGGGGLQRSGGKGARHPRTRPLVLDDADAQRLQPAVELTGDPPLPQQLRRLTRIVGEEFGEDRLRRRLRRRHRRRECGEDQQCREAPGVEPGIRPARSRYIARSPP